MVCERQLSVAFVINWEECGAPIAQFARGGVDFSTRRFLGGDHEERVVDCFFFLFFFLSLILLGLSIIRKN